MFDRVAVLVSGVEVGTMLPIGDCLHRDTEVRGATDVDQLCFMVGELGVAPFPVTRRDQVDVLTVDLTVGVRLSGGRHRIELAATPNETVGATVADVGFTGKPGTRCFRSVTGPDLAVVPLPDQPTPDSFRTIRFGAEPDDEFVDLGVGERRGVETGERVDRRV